MRQPHEAVQTIEPDEPRIIQIADGVWAQVEDRSIPLPRHLESHEGRMTNCHCTPLLQAMTGVERRPAPVRGARLDCRDQHDLVTWITGTYRTHTPDPLNFLLSRSLDLDLCLSVCRFCGMVQVKDVSLGLIVDEDPRGRRLYITPLDKAVRKDAVLGWYAGRRASGRTYV